MIIWWLTFNTDLPQYLHEPIDTHFFLEKWIKKKVVNNQTTARDDVSILRFRQQKMSIYTGCTYKQND